MLFDPHNEGKVTQLCVRKRVRLGLMDYLSDINRYWFHSGTQSMARLFRLANMELTGAIQGAVRQRVRHTHPQLQQAGNSAPELPLLRSYATWIPGVSGGWFGDRATIQLARRPLALVPPDGRATMRYLVSPWLETSHTRLGLNFTFVHFSIEHSYTAAVRGQ